MADQTKERDEKARSNFAVANALSPAVAIAHAKEGHYGERLKQLAQPLYVQFLKSQNPVKDRAVVDGLVEAEEKAEDPSEVTGISKKALAKILEVRQEAFANSYVGDVLRSIGIGPKSYFPGKQMTSYIGELQQANEELYKLVVGTYENALAGTILGTVLTQSAEQGRQTLEARLDDLWKPKEDKPKANGNGLRVVNGKGRANGQPAEAPEEELAEAA